MDASQLHLLIPVMLLLPLGGALLLLLIPGLGKANVAPKFALVSTLGTLAISLLMYVNFDWANSADLQLRSNTAWVKGFGLNLGLGVDSISLWLVLLTTCLMPLVVLGSFSAVKERSREFYLWLLLLQAAMLGTFVATDIILFYVCFEFTLIPLYFLIGIFGSTQRLEAARVFFLYTFTGSMLTFAGILFVAWSNATATGTWTFSIAQLTAAAQALPHNQQMWVLLALLAGFAVKVPLFPVHTWLPLAHTEAPTAASVILAGVLLKLGTYGLLRFAVPMVPLALADAAAWISILAIVGILYTALICWVQKDLKKLIAYSSVSHLGFCVLGLMALNPYGMSGSVVYMINHGLSTGALFLCVGMIYERFHTRELKQLGGLARVMPVWAFFMVFFSLASVGLPGLNGFVGEFLCLLGAFMAPHLGFNYALAAGLGMIFGAIYLLFMVGKVVFGPVVVPHVEHAAGGAAGGHDDHVIKDLGKREIVTLTVLAVLCLWLGLYPAPILRSLDAPLAKLAEPANRVLTARADTGQPDNMLTLVLPAPQAGTTAVKPVAGDVSRSGEQR